MKAERGQPIPLLQLIARRSVRALRDALASLSHRPSLKTSRLGLKLLVVVTLGVLLGMGLASLITLSMQRQELRAAAQRSAERVGAAVLAGLDQAMLRGDTAAVAQILASVPGRTGLEHLRILNTSGVVWQSSVSGEAGMQYPASDPLCRACHSGDRDGAGEGPIPTSQVTASAILTALPIENREVCRACHVVGSGALGLLLVETPLDTLYAELDASVQRRVLTALVTLALVLAVVLPALTVLVLRPVQELARAAAEISAGNLDYAPQVRQADELGGLGDSFRTMQQRLKDAHAALEQRNRDLLLLNQITYGASRLLEPKQILDLTVDAAITSFDVEAGVIALLNESRDRFLLHTCRGLPDCGGVACRLLSANYALAGRSAAPYETLVPTADGDESRCFWLWDDAQGRSCIGLLLRSGGSTVATMTLLTRPGRPFTDEAVSTLKQIGDAVAAALMHAIRFREVRSSAALAERDRLSREIHDSLAQALGYLKLKAALADEMLAAGQFDAVRENLQEFRQLAGETYTDVRETIFGLRESDLPGFDLMLALDRYVAEYRVHYQLDVTLQIEATPPALDGETAIQVYRIVQEALANIRKHACATRVWVRVSPADSGWQIVVEDDGLGFAPEETRHNGSQSYGLQIMRERAESVGAALELDSEPGRGTRVAIRVPVTSAGPEPESVEVPRGGEEA